MAKLLLQWPKSYIKWPLLNPANAPLLDHASTPMLDPARTPPLIYVRTSSLAATATLCTRSLSHLQFVPLILLPSGQNFILAVYVWTLPPVAKSHTSQMKHVTMTSQPQHCREKYDRYSPQLIFKILRKIKVLCYLHYKLSKNALK